MSLERCSQEALETTINACSWLISIAEACDPSCPEVVGWLENLGQHCRLEQIRRESTPEEAAIIELAYERFNRGGVLQ